MQKFRIFGFANGVSSVHDDIHIIIPHIGKKRNGEIDKSSAFGANRNLYDKKYGSIKK